MYVRIDDERLRAIVHCSGSGDDQRGQLVVDYPLEERYRRKVRRALAALVAPDREEGPGDGA